MGSVTEYENLSVATRNHRMTMDTACCRLKKGHIKGNLVKQLVAQFEYHSCITEMYGTVQGGL